MQHFKPVISNGVSLSGNSVPFVASHGLADSKSGRSLLPVTVDKAKAHLWFGRDIVGSERWQR